MATAGGLAAPTFTVTSGATTLNEGDSIYVNYSYTNQVSNTVYWAIDYYPSVPGLSGPNNFTGDTSGSIYVNGTGSSAITIHAKDDGVTEGNWYFGVKFGSSPGNNDLGYVFWYTVNDTSHPANGSLFLDLDTANYSGSTWQDNAGYSMNATTYNVTVSEDYGTTFVFNGSTSYALVPELNTSDYQSVTISAWINSAALGTTQTILAKELCYKFRIGADGSLSFAVSSNGTGWGYTASTGGGTITVGSWYYVVATADVSQTAIYVNGSKIINVPGLTIGQNSFPFVIGAYANNNPPADFFNGSIGEVKMWNFALTDSDIANEYTNTRSRYTLPATNDYTVEFWAKPNWLTVVGTYPRFFAKSEHPTEKWGLSVARGGSSNWYVAESMTSGEFAAQFAGLTTIDSLTGGWHHIALVRHNSIDTVYLDGVAQGSGHQTRPLIDIATDLHIGGANTGTGAFAGNITNFHIQKGYAKYTSNFTPSTDPVVPNQYTKLLLPATTSGTYLNDYSGLNKTPLGIIGSGSVVWDSDTPLSSGGSLNINQAVIRYAGSDADLAMDYVPGSVAFNGTNSMITLNNHTNMGLGSTYSISFWIKADRSSTGNHFFIPMSQGLTNGDTNAHNMVDVTLGNGNMGFANTEFGWAEPSVGGVPTGVSNWNGGGGWNQGYYTNLATTGGTGTGLTVDVAAGGGGYININAITIHTPGSGYTDGDVITIVNENSIGGTFTISATALGSVWTHVCIVSDGTANTFKAYYNGSQVFAYSSALALSDTTNNLVIGARPNNTDPNAQYFFPGKLSYVKITAGTAVDPVYEYNHSFPAATQSGTVLLLANLAYSDSTISDYSGGSSVVIPNNVHASADVPSV